ncbi:hypothetical protein A0J61_11944 [Choanephora cucurbitarum]|uniref:ATP-dependent DNA helicase n=1 Tax=Choanephora cucurbitarum TaxID=101091 RepID=A0A1C7LQM2_9FUNG|nr:hypothetical protein A0J61_11944 [Choanephora cucurbitarum]
MGGIKSIFFGDLAQLLPYCLMEPVRQTEADFVEILNEVRLCHSDESVIKSINSRAVMKSDIPNKLLRLYTTRQRVNAANSKDFDSMSGVLKTK